MRRAHWDLGRSRFAIVPARIWATSDLDRIWLKRDMDLSWIWMQLKSVADLAWTCVGSGRIPRWQSVQQLVNVGADLAGAGFHRQRPRSMPSDR